MNLLNIQLDFAAAFVLILAIPFFAYLYWKLIAWREKIVKIFAASAIAASLLTITSKNYAMRRAVYLIIAWLFAVFAFAQPKGGARYPEETESTKTESKGIVKRKSHDLIFAIDTSQSMAIRDSDQAKTRLEKAKELSDELAGTVRGDSVNLYAFTSEATALVPPTIDYIFFRLMLTHMTYNEGEVAGTDLLQTLHTIFDQIREEPYEKNRILLLFTDGGDTEWESAIGEQKTRREQQILAAAQAIANLKTTIYVVGTGSLAGEVVPDILYHGKEVKSVLEQDLLQKIAQTGQGYYWGANSQATTQLVNEISAKIKDQTASTQYLSSGRSGGAQKELIYDYYFQVPLLLSIFFLTIAVCIPLKTLALGERA